MSDYRLPFEKLGVWQDAKCLVKDVYTMTKDFPATEKFGLVSQMNRAVVSVASNLAEGSSRASLKDQAHFSQIAYGSLMELACQVVLAEELEFTSRDTGSAFRIKFVALANKINALRNSQLKRSV